MNQFEEHPSQEELADKTKSWQDVIKNGNDYFENC